LHIYETIYSKVYAIPYLIRKYAGPALDLDNFEVHQKIPLTAYGRPGFLTVIYQLIW
jgi:hypothetical protein